MMTINNDILNVLKESNNVAICCHIKPDADCLGSASALKSALIQMGKTADIFCDSVVSDNFSFLPHIKDVNPVMGVYDLVVAVDCADASRVGRYISLFKENENSISIDHHMFGAEKYSKYSLVEDLSSTALILYYLFKQMEIEITEDIAVALYAGMASDTGGFLHSNTTAELHTVVGEVMQVILDVTEINYYLFKKRTKGQMELLKTMLNNLKFICDNKVAISYLTSRDFERTGTLDSETYGLVDFCTNIEGVEIGILISEKSKNLYSCSLRGRNRNVSIIASHFGGGGHKFASGCNIFGGYKSIIDKLEKVIKDNYDRICEC